MLLSGDNVSDYLFELVIFEIYVGYHVRCS